MIVTTTNKERAAMQQALEALEFAYRNIDEGDDVIYEAITALREALAKQDTAMKQLRDVQGAQGRDGTWNRNEYMRGLFNGLELALAICECREPDYREALDHIPDATKMVGCAYCNNTVFAGTKCNNCGLVTLAEPQVDWKEEALRLAGLNAKHVSELRKLKAEQAEQEPVGYFAYDEEHDIWEELTGPNAPGATPLYAAPQPVQQVDLTDDEVVDVMNKIYGSMWTEQDRDFARAVIAADRRRTND